jgi:hypothetical protein
LRAGRNTQSQQKLSEGCYSILLTRSQSRVTAQLNSESIPALAKARTVYVTLEHRGTWTAIGRLDRRADRYVFRYTNGALQLGTASRLLPMSGFPKLTQRYESKQLFDVFARATPRESDPLRAQFLEHRGLPAESVDPIDVLATGVSLELNGRLRTLPNLRGDDNGRYEFSMFVRGPNADSPLARKLEAGQPLWANVAVAASGKQVDVILVDERREFVDYLPPLIAQELAPVLNRDPRPAFELRRVDLAQREPGERLLVSVRGRWPDRYEPLQRIAYAPILI